MTVGDVHGGIHFHGARPAPGQADFHPSDEILVRRYLEWLVADCAPLKLKAIDQAAAKPGAEPLALSSVYMDLNTDLRFPDRQSSVIILINSPAFCLTRNNHRRLSAIRISCPAPN